jgi:Allene oxide cyclase barrel like domain
MNVNRRRKSMRKYWLVPVLVATLAAVWAWTASATDGPGTLTLIEVSIPKNDRPLGDFTFDRPPMSGDRFVVKNALFEKGRRVGRVEVLHTFITGFGPTFARKATVLFVAQLFVRGGTILAEGYGQVVADGPAKLTFPIVGGTGRYADVRGSINVRTLSENKTRLDLALLP